MRLVENVMMVRTIGLAEAGLAKVDQAVITDMLSSQHIRAAALLEAVIEHKVLRFRALLPQRSAEFKSENKHFLGHLKHHSTSSHFYFR
jgi:hypothetical protein